MKRMSLDVIEVARPCPADWEAMRGAGATRFCEHCRREVHDLSAMPREEAERLVCESAGRLCVRFMRDSAGKVIALDYQPRAKGWSRRWWIGFGFVGAILGATLNLLILSWRGWSAVAPGPVMGALPAAPVMGQMPFIMGDMAMPTEPEGATDPIDLEATKQD